MVSEKQLAANQQNALKSTGPKTVEGKALASRNSLKHGLLAKNVVITEGEGAEDRQAFEALLADFIDQFNSVGSLEEMLVEKIVVCYWRLGRANRYEVGVLRQTLDTATNDYFNQRGHEHETDVQIDVHIENCQNALKDMNDEREKLSQLIAEEGCLEEIYNDDEIRKRLLDTYPDLLAGCTYYSTPAIKNALTRQGVTDVQIRQSLMESCLKQIRQFLSDIERYKRDKVTNKLRLSALKLRGALPPKIEMDNLLRYETAIERQLYKSINQLERSQRQRIGDYVPAPVQVDLNIEGLKTGA